jgi:hypothetical protein
LSTIKIQETEKAKKFVPVFFTEVFFCSDKLKIKQIVLIFIVSLMLMHREERVSKRVVGLWNLYMATRHKCPSMGGGEGDDTQTDTRTHGQTDVTSSTIWIPQSISPLGPMPKKSPSKIILRVVDFRKTLVGAKIGKLNKRDFYKS